MGMGQRVNPHTLRVGVVKDFDSSWYNESGNIDYESQRYLSKKMKNISLCSLGLLERRVKLIKILGMQNYKKVINKVKTLSR